jgi:UrcA family protein
MKTKFFAAAFGLAAFAAVAPTSASNVSGGGGVPSLDVTYSDLNLANRAGAEALLRRIRSAASQVCGGDQRSATMKDLKMAREFRACVRTAVDDPVRQVNSPLVTAVYRGGDVVEPRYAEDLAR